MKGINACILLLLALGVTVNGSHMNHCSSFSKLFTATNDKIIQTAVVCVEKVTSAIQCVRYCHADPNCQSVNYFKTDHLCQLSNTTRVHFPNVFTHYGSIYYDIGDGEEQSETSQHSEYSITQTPTTEAMASLGGSDGTWTQQELSIIDKPSTQSSNFGGNYVAGRANDGHTHDTMVKSPYCSHTGHEIHPWWRVDLEEERWLGNITVVNRGDCCGFKLAGATVRAGLSSIITDNMMCGSPVGQAQAQDGAWIEFVCDPTTLARYISVDINTCNSHSVHVINICEVMVREYIRVAKSK